MKKFLLIFGFVVISIFSLNACQPRGLRAYAFVDENQNIFIDISNKEEYTPLSFDSISIYKLVNKEEFIYWHAHRIHESRKKIDPCPLRYGELLFGMKNKESTQAKKIDDGIYIIRGYAFTNVNAHIEANRRIYGKFSFINGKLENLKD